jgi:nucleoside-diphosphate-sugar epimerase
MSILSSAIKYRNIKRVVITSSIVAILSENEASGGSTSPISSFTRVTPLPVAPFNDYTPSTAYLASKALSLDATDKFVKNKKPHFSVVNIMPGFVFGRNELAQDTNALVSGSNALVLGIVLNFESFLPGKLPLMVTHIQDVARVQIKALDEKKVALSAGESRSFLLDGECKSNGIDFDDANDIVRRAFPEAVKEGKLKLGGRLEVSMLNIESAETVETFGKLRSYEDAVRSVVGQYLELLAKE